jgi:hypothetical protein
VRVRGIARIRGGAVVVRLVGPRIRRRIHDTAATAVGRRSLHVVSHGHIGVVAQRDGERERGHLREGLVSRAGFAGELATRLLGALVLEVVGVVEAVVVVLGLLLLVLTLILAVMIAAEVATVVAIVVEPAVVVVEGAPVAACGSPPS